MKRYALLFGENGFREPLNPLKFAIKDVESLELFFKDKLSFDQVKVLKNGATDNEVLDEAERLCKNLGAGDLFVFIASTHGVAIHGRMLLLTQNARKSEVEHGRHVVPMEVLKRRTKRPGLHRLFILDICRSQLYASKGAQSDGFAGSDILRQLTKDIAAGTEKAKTPAFLTLLWSCDDGNVAFELQKRQHGLFSIALLEELAAGLARGSSLSVDASFRNRLGERMNTLAEAEGLDGEQQPCLELNSPPPVLMPANSDCVSQHLPQQQTAKYRPPAGIPPAWSEPLQSSHAKRVRWVGLPLGLALAIAGFLIWHLHSAAPFKVSSPPGQTSTSLGVSQPPPNPAAPPAENQKSEELVERETTRRHLNPETLLTTDKSEQNLPKPANEKLVADPPGLKNPYLDISSNQYSIAILIANETGQPNTQLAYALRQLLNTNGITTTASLFSPRFIADGLLDKTIAGSKEPLEQLDLKNIAHAVFLAQQSVEYSTNYELNGVITATMTVALNVLSTRPSELLFATAINAAGAGFSRPQARQMAEQRILNQLGDGRLVVVQQAVLKQYK